MYKLHFDNFLINEHDDDDDVCVRSSVRVDAVVTASASPSRLLQQSAVSKVTHNQSDVMSSSSRAGVDLATSRPECLTAASRRAADMSPGSRPAADVSPGSRRAADMSPGSRRAADVSPGSRRAADMSAGSCRGVKSASNRSASGSKVSSRTAGAMASSRSPCVVPLQADFKPCGTPRCASMNAVATHVDEQCHVFVHEIHTGLYLSKQHCVNNRCPGQPG